MAAIPAPCGQRTLIAAMGRSYRTEFYRAFIIYIPRQCR